jgi:hypothetical protein
VTAVTIMVRQATGVGEFEKRSHTVCPPPKGILRITIESNPIITAGNPAKKEDKALGTVQVEFIVDLAVAVKIDPILLGDTVAIEIDRARENWKLRPDLVKLGHSPLFDSGVGVGPVQIVRMLSRSFVQDDSAGRFHSEARLESGDGGFQTSDFDDRTRFGPGPWS